MLRADQYDALDAETAARWANFGQRVPLTFPGLLGLEVEEVRVDYCRMRLPAREQLLQAGGAVVHGGVIASLLDSVVVPAIGAGLPEDAEFATVDLHVQYHRALRGAAVAEGWVTRRGRRVVFCESEAISADTGHVIARALLTYNVSLPRN
jgi:uncharacterized protein (TIGR00369 family)